MTQVDGRSRAGPGGPRRRVSTDPGAVLLAACLLAAPPAAAVDPGRPIDENVRTVWTPRDGLPGATISEVFQDARGYVWIGSFNGLVRFDGARFEPLPSDGPTIRSATAIVEATDGALWIGTHGDGLVRIAGGKWTAVTEKEGLPGDSIRALCRDGSGGVYAGTGDGAARVDASGAVRPIADGALPKEAVELVHLDRQGSLWVSFRSGAFHRVARHGAGPSEEVALRGVTPVLSLLEARDGTFWFGTRDGRLLHAARGGIEDLSPVLGLAAKPVNTLLEDAHGAIWAGTDAGVFRLHDGTVSRFDAANGLSDDQVNRIREDHEGNVWIATARGGVTKLSDGKFVTLTTRNGLPNDTVNCVARDRDGALWIGTDRGLGVLRGGAFVDHPAAREVGSARVRHVTRDRAGRMWVSTYDGRGVLVFDGAGVRSLSKADGLTGDRCRMVLEDRSGVVWIATTTGLNRLEKGRVRTYTRADGLGDDYILSIHEDSARNLWIGTNGGGLQRLSDGRLEVFRKESGLGSDVVFGIFEDRRGGLWAATTGGVSLFSGGRFRNVSSRQGLPGNAVFQVLEDAAGRFWMRGDVAVFTVPGDELRAAAAGDAPAVKAKLFDDRDGLLGAPTPASWAFQAEDGKLWLPTLQGVATIDPVRIRENPIPPRVVLEEVLVDGTARAPETFERLDPGYRRVTFRYTGLSYVVPDRVSFRVTLEGFDEDWSEVTRRREATYTSLPPGSYTFRVRACNDDGVWNEKEAYVSFVQPPLFRQSGPFRALAGAALVAAILGLLAWRTAALRRRKAELERLVEARTEELRGKNVELERSERTIREANEALERLSRTDPLTGLANRRHVEETLEREWARQAREKGPLAVLMLDIDSFKAFNDTYGHQAGDECLRQVARAIEASVRGPQDVAGRYGGEEFIVVLPRSETAAAAAVGERVRRRVEELGILHAGSPCAPVVTVSVGAASARPGDDASAEALVHRADDALYASKGAGRNRVTPPPDDVAGEG